VLRRDADAIDAVIVGNEVLLRRELAAAALADYIRRVRAATTLPVTYADVWEFWLQNPEVADAASFVTVHMLPYWEDEPMPIERAVDHVVRTLARVRAAFPGRDVFVGEAGWPSTGRSSRIRRGGRVSSQRGSARSCSRSPAQRGERGSAGCCSSRSPARRSARRPRRSAR
jgi:glucan 1,3-beta-glucosidase